MFRSEQWLTLSTTILVTFSSLRYNTQHAEFKGGEVYFGSQFLEHSVHCKPTPRHKGVGKIWCRKATLTAARKLGMPFQFTLAVCCLFWPDPTSSQHIELWLPQWINPLEYSTPMIYSPCTHEGCGGSQPWQESSLFWQSQYQVLIALDTLCNTCNM